ncbi:IniB N-terminal domain-containing protein [Amycolatopsis sp. CA-128772]|uniref:IniB N-terminal domain-containing protein n=1 Tax=Amycolatopsis sp. CA-128772 TaxID=2073159 RepID=UPI000CD1384A|nr:IniB N-terminal domain-containing protein [Amycolatopsis sp. CA-128772]
MNPAQSLYEFTLNLLNNPSARSAFGDDPQGTLDGAGLGDISGADLHDILPLVLDFAPVGNLGDENGLNLDSITGQASAVEQLKALTQNLALGDTTSENNVLGAVSGMTALTQNTTDPFSAAGDLTSSIDHIGGGQADPVTTVTGAVGDVTGHVAGGDVTGALDGGNITSGLQDVSGLTSAIDNAQGVGSTIGDLTGNLGVNTGLEHTVDDVTAHGVDDVVTHLGDISHNGTLGDVTNHVGDIASHAGSISDVHDVVGNIGEGALSGTIGADLSHLSIGSGNDVHLPH